MTVEELTRRSRQLVLQDPRLLADVSSKELADPARAPLKAWVKWWRKWPLEHLAGEGFALSDDRFAVQRRVDSADAQVPADLLNELIDWRLARYLQTREPVRGGGCCGSGDPGREQGTDPRPPTGALAHRCRKDVGIQVLVDSQWVTSTSPRSRSTSLAATPRVPTLRAFCGGWFGPDAGASGTDHQGRACWRRRGGWRAMPIARDGHVAGEGVGGH